VAAQQPVEKRIAELDAGTIDSIPWGRSGSDGSIG
jgi:hypothetical protein